MTFFAKIHTRIIAEYQVFFRVAKRGQVIRQNLKLIIVEIVFQALDEHTFELSKNNRFWPPITVFI